MASASLLSVSSSPEVVDESLIALIELKIAECCGPQLPCRDSAAILGGFLRRFTPDQVMAIISQAFDVHRGTWRGAPITVLRFQAHHDEFFALPLLQGHCP
ncbi:MAG: hypothetical protein JWM19_851 [Actinomycetia bacterium]|nr:hypothetical protein [Actinomycetes bacterium]